MWRHTIFQAIVPLEHRDVPQAIHYAWFFHPATEVSNRISLKPNLEIAGIIQPDIPVLAFLPEAVAQCLESRGYAEWRSLSHRASDRFSKEMLLENHIVGVPPHVYFIFNQFGDFKITYFFAMKCSHIRRMRQRQEGARQGREVVNTTIDWIKKMKIYKPRRRRGPRQKW